MSKTLNLRTVRNRKRRRSTAEHHARERAAWDAAVEAARSVGVQPWHMKQKDLMLGLRVSARDSPYRRWWWPD